MPLLRAKLFSAIAIAVAMRCTIREVRFPFWGVPGYVGGDPELTCQVAGVYRSGSLGYGSAGVEVAETCKHMRQNVFINLDFLFCVLVFAQKKNNIYDNKTNK